MKKKDLQSILDKIEDGKEIIFNSAAHVYDRIESVFFDDETGNAIVNIKKVRNYDFQDKAEGVKGI